MSEKEADRAAIDGIDAREREVDAQLRGMAGELQARPPPIQTYCASVARMPMLRSSNCHGRGASPGRPRAPRDAAPREGTGTRLCARRRAAAKGKLPWGVNCHRCHRCRWARS
jgi:hypothetical protein